MTATTGPTTENRWLKGNFAPVREELTLTELDVTGKIPDFLDGRYVRNGPNPIVDPEPSTYDYFTGTGMVHGVRLRDGQADWYRNRWVRSGPVAEALGEDWVGGPVHGFDFGGFINVIGHGGRTLALMEGGGLPYELTETLDTVGPATSTAPCPAGTPPTPTVTPRPANSTASPTSGDGATRCVTRCSASTAASGVTWTSSSPAAP